MPPEQRRAAWGEKRGLESRFPVTTAQDRCRLLGDEPSLPSCNTAVVPLPSMPRAPPSRTLTGALAYSPGSAAAAARQALRLRCKWWEGVRGREEPGALARQDRPFLSQSEKGLWVGPSMRARAGVPSFAPSGRVYLVIRNRTEQKQQGSRVHERSHEHCLRIIGCSRDWGGGASSARIPGPEACSFA